MNQNTLIAITLLIPFLGTTTGSACVFFMHKDITPRMQSVLSGFAAGVMVSATAWSLLVPAIEASQDMGKLAFIPAVVGFWFGVLLLLALDEIIPHVHALEDRPEGPQNNFQKTTLMVIAVTLHNFPEGMAVGVVCAGWLAGAQGITASAAIAIALGIAIQNFPEGAIISMPLKAQGISSAKAFIEGALSGIVEPIGAGLTILFASQMVPALPYLLGFAAGAMMYVVVDDLVPEISNTNHTNLGALMFAFGFTLMMALDIALG